MYDLLGFFHWTYDLLDVYLNGYTPRRELGLKIKTDQSEQLFDVEPMDNPIQLSRKTMINDILFLNFVIILIQCIDFFKMTSFNT